MKIFSSSVTEYMVSDVHINALLEQQYCVFDLEATGPDPREDYITQIGAVIIDSNGVQQNQFNAWVRPLKPIPEKIEKLTGIYNKNLQDARSFSEAIHDFKMFCQDCILVTQAGYEYDFPLLMAECRRNNIPMIDQKMIDTKALFTYLHPDVQEIVSTDFLIKYFGTEDQDIERHSAVGDSILIARIFQRLLDECRTRQLNHISFDQLTVKKVKLKLLE